MHRIKRKKGLTETLLAERMDAAAVKKHTVTPKKQKKTVPKIIVSKHTYAAYKKARNILLDALGAFSRQRALEQITVAEMEQMALDGVKKSIRTVGLKTALLAWNDVFQYLDTPEHREIKGMKIQLYAMVRVWREQFNWKNPYIDLEVKDAAIYPLPKQEALDGDEK